MGGEQLVDFHPRFKAEHAADLRLGELLGPIALDGEGFESFAGGVLAGSDDLGGERFRDVEGDLHEDRVAPGFRRVSAAVVWSQVS